MTFKIGNSIKDTTLTTVPKSCTPLIAKIKLDRIFLLPNKLKFKTYLNIKNLIKENNIKDDTDMITISGVKFPMFPPSALIHQLYRS